MLPPIFQPSEVVSDTDRGRGLRANFFVDGQVTWTVEYAGPAERTAIEALNFQQWDFLFGIALVAGLYALHCLSAVAEVEEPRRRAVLGHLLIELGREVRSVASVGTQFLLTAFDWEAPRAPRRNPTLLQSRESGNETTSGEGA